MNDFTKAAVITLVIGAIVFSLTGFIWPSSESYTQPTGNQVYFFKMVSILESCLFGLGIAFFVLMWPMLKRAWKIMHWPTMLSILSLTWMFLNWWPHDNMHLFFGPEMETLIFIEGFFHGSMIVAVVIVAWSYYRAVSGQEE